jgi:hypothetical protein
LTSQEKNSSIIINYESENKEMKELIFSLTVNVYENKFNNYVASECNIFDFVNEHIPKQENIIDL